MSTGTPPGDGAHCSDADQSPARRRWWPVLLGLLLMTPVLWIAARHVINGTAQLPAPDSRNLPVFILLALALALVIVCNGLVLRDLSAWFGTRLKAGAWLGVTLASSMLNIVSPVKGGAALRALYLQRMHGMSLTSVAGVLGVSFLFSIVSSAAVATIALLTMGIPGGTAGAITLAASLAIVVTPIVLLLLAPPVSKAQGNRMLRRAARLYDGWRSISRDPPIMRRLLAWNTLATVLHAVAFVCAFRLAGFDGHWLVPVTSSAFARIGALVALTPAGIGVYEAFGTVSAHIAGADAGPALIAVLIVRAVGSIIVIAGGLVSWPLLTQHATVVRSRGAIKQRWTARERDR